MNPRTPKTDAEPPPPVPAVPDAESVADQDRRLDEELAETFPASDPIPVRHDS